MSNRASYHAMMNEVRAPERVLGKAKDITMEKTKRAPWRSGTPPLPSHRF